MFAGSSDRESGLSLGGVMLAVILAVALIFVFCIKGGSKGDGSSIPLGSTVVYDDQYTYFLSETETWEPCIKRVSNDLRGKPEILYEAEEIKGDGWSQYPMGGIFLWNEKICFIEITKATEQGNDEYEIRWHFFKEHCRGRQGRRQRARGRLAQQKRQGKRDTL